MTPTTIPSSDHSPSLDVSVMGLRIPAIFAGQNQANAVHVVEFFAAHIRNIHTRRAYLRAITRFAQFCTQYGIAELKNVQPLHIAAWIEQEGQRYSKPTVKQALAATKALFDWLVVRQVLTHSPAASVRGPRYSAKRGKTPILDASTTRMLLDAIETDTSIGLRDRALIGIMIYAFARIGAAIKMQVEDYYYEGHRAWVRLHEKGGQDHEMPVHHALQDLLEDYLSGANLKHSSGPLFQTIRGRSGKLSGRAMSQSDAWNMLQHRARSANINMPVTNHTFRATGITQYLLAGGKLEVAQRMANHESSRTTGLYDRRSDIVSLNEIERIRI